MSYYHPTNYDILKTLAAFHGVVIWYEHMTDIERARLIKLINEASDAAERILENLKRINARLDGKDAG